MPRIIAIAIIVVISGGALLHAATKEPQNGPELVKVLRTKYGIDGVVDREGNIYAAIFEGNAQHKATTTIDRIVRIPTIIKN